MFRELLSKTHHQLNQEIPPSHWLNRYIYQKIQKNIYIIRLDTVYNSISEQNQFQNPE